MGNPVWSIQTGRLRLAPVGWTDLADLVALKADPAVFAQMLGGVRLPEQTAREMADDVQFWARHGVGMWAVRPLAGGGLLGLTGIHDRPDGRGFGLRFAFWPSSRGHGYAREAAGAGLRYAHEVGGVRRVVAVTKETNFDSRTVLGSIGMRLESSFPRGGETMLLFSSER